MLRDITLGQYYPADSILHRLAPRVKFVGTIVYVVSLFLFHNWGYLLGTVFLAVMIKLSKVPFKFITKGLKSIFVLLAITMVFNILFTPGEVLVRIWKITITREGNLRVVRFDNYVNGEFLNSYSADGIIIATPTGSTGYSLSAGGPIISPSASLMLMTPLAPHTLNTRSIVFPAEDVIEVELGPSRDGGIEQGMAYFDGGTRVPMKTGDRIVIKKARRDTLIVKISNISFLETLRKKMANI